MKHHVQWLTASPLWPDFDAGAVPLRRPALLRFTSDEFMDDLISLLEREPRQLLSHLAKSEEAPGRSGLPQLKLFQPIHGHFNVLAASLVCRTVGLPDRAVDTAQDENVSFILRRLGRDGEEAWLPGSPSGTWQPLEANQAQELAPNEELLPMFPMRFVEGPRRRKIFVGLIPTSSRDTFAAAKTSDPIVSPGGPSRKDARLIEVEERVLDTLDQLKNIREPQQGAALDQQRDVSQFILLDLAEFLANNFPGLKRAIESGQPPASGDPGSAIHQILASAMADRVTSWLVALEHVWRERDRISSGQSPRQPILYNLKNSNLDTSRFRRHVEAAIAKMPPRPDSQDKPVLPKLGSKSDSAYVLRCVYQRPQCGMGSTLESQATSSTLESHATSSTLESQATRPLHPDVLSDPTEPFTIAPYFDPQAPARPIRISLPVDTTIAGLRQAKKNVSFVISNQLRQQMSRATNLKKVMDGDIGEGTSFELGEICSFSIPIITICAFIVLMIFLILLNIVFWWLPFLRICLPIPLKKG